MSTSVPTAYGGGKWSIFVGIVLILGGVAAIALPFFAGIAAAIYFGWLILFGGIAHLVYAWSERHAGPGTVLWQILIGIIYLIAAIWILLLPIAGIVALTLVLASYIAVEGVLELVLFSRLRKVSGTAWFLVDGIVSLLLAVLILLHWPVSSFWALGTLLGISLLVSGMARLTMPMVRRRVVVVAA